MEQVAVLVGCGSAKQDTDTVAKDMYTSGYFSAKYGAADELGDPKIISAKHGLLQPDTIVSPYDEYGLSGEKMEQIVADLSDDYDTVYVLAGKDYRYPLCSMLEEAGYEVKDPFDGTSGIGEQKSWCIEVADGN